MSRTRASTLAALVVAAAAGCGGSGHGSPSTLHAAHRVANAGFTIEAPAGWASDTFVSPPGVILAVKAAEFTAEAPSAARISVQAVPSATPRAETLLLGINRAPYAAAPVVGQTTVDGHPATTTEWTQPVGGVNETRRVIAVSLARGTACLIVLEAPTSQWQSDRPVLEAALASLKIDVATVAVDSK
jgi:hypothetical protein